MLKISSSSSKVERNPKENPSQERIFYPGYDILKSKQLNITGFLHLPLMGGKIATHFAELSMERVKAAACEVAAIDPWRLIKSSGS
jgi:hypothetical protein